MRVEKIIVLECALDHLTGEEVGLALRALNDMAEILDALYLPGIGKKNRPAGLLQALCLPENELAARDAVFRHTHVLGLRRRECERYVIDRRPDETVIAGQKIAAKTHVIENRSYTRPEADAIAALAERLNVGAPALRFSKRN